MRAVEEIVAVGTDDAPRQRAARRPGRPTAPGLRHLANRLSDVFETRVKVELGQPREDRRRVRLRWTTSSGSSRRCPRRLRRRDASAARRGEPWPSPRAACGPDPGSSRPVDSRETLPRNRRGLLHAGRERVDVGFGGVEGGHPADHGVALVPDMESPVPPQALDVPGPATRRPRWTRPVTISTPARRARPSASRRAMALAWVALRSQSSSCSSAPNCAARSASWRPAGSAACAGKARQRPDRGPSR